jgi:hypothetical protein
MAALPTQTPAIIVRTRTITRTVVVTPTPVPPPSGPQHLITGATHCTDENMCVRPLGYTLRAAPPDGECWTFGRQWKRLDVWFHVANGGPYGNSLSSGLFAAAIRGWSVVEADPIAKKGSANITLALDGDRELDGRETFDVPVASHAATIRFHSAWSKAQRPASAAAPPACTGRCLWR